MVPTARFKGQNREMSHKGETVIGEVMGDVAVACAAAGIILGIVNPTGTGLRFSSLVVSLSQGIFLPALLLVALTSLLLGMGLPMTASYIVLIILAGPGLMDLGIPLLTAHMIAFW